jgi:hypothetical protein
MTATEITPRMATAAAGPMMADAVRRGRSACPCPARDTVAAAIGAATTGLAAINASGADTSDSPSSWKQRQQYVRVAGLRVSHR